MHCCNINKSRRGDFFLVHLVYDTPFRSQIVSKSTGVQDRGKISYPLNPCKIQGKGWLVKCVSEFLRVQPTTKPLLYTEWAKKSKLLL